MSQALQEFTRISRYSRYRPDLGRRETWAEQVDRVFDMHAEFFSNKMNEIQEDFNFAKQMVLAKKVLPSMRSLQFGGPSILRKHARMYNCSATFIDRPRSFQEVMWLLLCGTGVGFSIQKHHIAKLPGIAAITNNDNTVVHVAEDSIEGWSDCLGALLSSYFISDQPFPQYFGKKVVFDLTNIRPKGSRISDMGGTAPGSKPLHKSLYYINRLLIRCIKQGQTHLKPIDAMDIICHASDSVIAGGVRRSACLSLFSADDTDMVNAKTGNWFVSNGQRGRSNNSALLLRNNVTRDEFEKIMESVKNFGEPGFIWSDNTEVVFNPCAEISLYPIDEKTGETGTQMCNLTEINAGAVKSDQDFYDACRASAILGTFQAAYTKFEYLGETSERIVERESLLGCSMTGIMENPKICTNPEILRHGAHIIKEVNKTIAIKLKIRPASRTTAIKPAGSTSCLLGSSSGIHPAHSRRYFRRVQVNKLEEPQKFFAKYNPDAIENSVWSANKSDNVITFLCETPQDALTNKDITAVDFLKYVKIVQENWVKEGRNINLCVQPWLQHNVSNTVTVKPNEWKDVTDYIYDNRENFTGISILPSSGDKTYKQAPFESILDSKEIITEFGNGAIFSSGVIIHALQAFNNDLFDACDAIMGLGTPLTIPDFKSQDHQIESQIDTLRALMEKILFVKRAKKFAHRYFDDDLQRMCYCLKSINSWKRWCDLQRSYTEVPWESFHEKDDNVVVNNTTACSSGGCELTRM